MEENKKSFENVQVVIATPSLRSEVPMQFYQTVMNMVLKTREKYPSMKFATLTAGNTYVHQARQNMTDAFLETKADYMLCIDDDNIPPEDGLIKLLEDDKPVVSGLYFKRRPPYEPLIMMKRRQGVGSERRSDIFREGTKELTQIHSCGFGFILIKREVLVKMRESRMPHFSMKVGLGEDIWFCIQAQGAGYDIWLDPQVEVGHLGDKQMITGKTYTDYYETHIKDLIEKADKVQGYMTLKELEVLANEAANSDFTIEVGSWKGRSATVLSASGKLTCVDTFEGLLDGHGKIDEGQFMDFLKNMDSFKNVSYLKGDSGELAQNFPDEMAMLILIDGLHTYDKCLDDLIKYWEKLKVGGKMLVHDYEDSFVPVKNAVKDFEDKHKVECVGRLIPDTTLYELVKI